MVLLNILGNQLAILENNQLTLQLRVYANVSVLAVSSIPTGVALCAKNTWHGHIDRNICSPLIIIIIYWLGKNYFFTTIN